MASCKSAIPVSKYLMDTLFSGHYDVVYRPQMKWLRDCFTIPRITTGADWRAPAEKETGTKYATN